MKKTVNKKEKGFTLIETLVAIFILVIAVTGPMSAAQNSLKASFLARDQVVAYYLAQDAIEGIKNLRDNDALSTPPRDWRTRVSGCVNAAGEYKQCNFDSSDTKNSWLACTPEDANNLSCPPMQLNSSDIFYFDGNLGNDSKYTRAIYLYETANPNETEVNVVIEWRTSLFLTERRIEVQENVFNWLPTS